jgi:hypothetical protein
MQSLLQPTFNNYRIFAYAHHPSLFPSGNSLHIIDQHSLSRRFSFCVSIFPIGAEPACI